MWSPTVLVGFALSVSGLSTIAILIASYEIYSDLNSLASSVEGELRLFKGLTNEAWDELMGINWKMESDNHVSSMKRRSIVERDVFVNKKGIHKVKTRQNVFLQQRLPAWCQCEPVRPTCPPGPRGPRGAPGAPGEPGNRGFPGDNNYETMRAPVCDTRITGCVRCPAGPPGNRGPMGFDGQPGPIGEPGPPGDRVGIGARGPQGERGEQGLPGFNGSPGEPGPSGKNAVAVVSKRGPPGLPGDGGMRGPPGGPGNSAPNGIPGAAGPPGDRGNRGLSGEPGRPGFPGGGGRYGKDSGYCPCPKRTMMIVKKTLAL